MAQTSHSRRRHAGERLCGTSVRHDSSPKSLACSGMACRQALSTGLHPSSSKQRSTVESTRRRNRRERQRVRPSRDTRCDPRRRSRGGPVDHRRSLDQNAPNRPTGSRPASGARHHPLRHRRPDPGEVVRRDRVLVKERRREARATWWLNRAPCVSSVDSRKVTPPVTA